MKENDFDRIAFCYDLLVKLVFGKSLARAQSAHLHLIKSEGRVLILGGGTGLILQQVLAQAENTRIDYVEASYEMLKRAKSRVEENPKVNFVHGTHEDIPAVDYDFIITPFVLDVFEADALMEVSLLLRDKLSEAGMLLCTDFGQTNRWYYRLLVWLMHRFFRLTTRLRSGELQDIPIALQRSGFNEVKKKTWKGGLLFSGIYENSA